MTAERWKRLFRDQGWVLGDRVGPNFSDSDEIVVVMRSSEERCFAIRDLIQATDDFLVFQGVYGDRHESDGALEPYKVWFSWEDILAVWDYRDPLKNAFA